MKITPLQQYIILGVIAFLGIAFLYYQFMLKPVITQIATLQTTLDDERKKLEEAKKIAATYDQFKKNADSVQRELEWYQNRIPKTVEKTKFMDAINVLQSRSSVLLTSFQFQAPASQKDYSELPATIRFNSDFKGLLNFLYQVSTSNLFMTARDLVITPVSLADHPDVTLQAQMVVSGIQAK